MILLVTHGLDEHGLEVLTRLRRRDTDPVVLDTARFPVEMAITVESSDPGAWNGNVVVEGVERDVTDIRVAWWRRPLPFVLHDDIRDEEDRAFAYGECHAAITGLWSCLDALWINDPGRDEVAARKMYQLKVASRIGLRTPRTCITTDPLAAARFAADEGPTGTIYKSFSATEKAWRETRVLRPEERDLLDNVRFAPVIFQEHVPAAVDLRITVVGDRMFPAEIASQETAYPHDFRMMMNDAPIRPHVLPAPVERQLRELMSWFGLVYGAIDMRLTPDGDYVFLEVNPAGQWLFIEQRTEQPITEALCDLLIDADGAGIRAG